jgi:hypothetical protein
MIETLSLTEPPQRWKKLDSEDPRLASWPLMGQLLDGVPNDHTKGVMAGLAAICDTVRIESNLDVEQMDLPAEIDLKDAMEDQNEILSALESTVPVLGETFKLMRRGEDAEFRRGLLMAYAIWYVKLSKMEISQEDAEASEGVEAEPAYSIPEQLEAADDEDNELDAETLGGENMTETTEKRWAKRWVEEITVRHICEDLNKLPLKLDISMARDVFVLTVIIQVSNLSANLLAAIEDSFRAINPEAKYSYVCSPLNGNITTLIPIPKDAKW